jgi:hypothetical protein
MAGLNVYEFGESENQIIVPINKSIQRISKTRNRFSVRLA